MKTRICKADYFITSILILITILLSTIFFKKKQGDYVQLTSPSGTYIYPLNKNAEYTLQGILGDTVVKIEDFEVKIISSPCPNKHCITFGAISKTGDFNACLPNGISMTIIGGSGDVDAVSI